MVLEELYDNKNDKAMSTQTHLAWTDDREKKTRYLSFIKFALGDYDDDDQAQRFIEEIFCNAQRKQISLDAKNY